MNCTSITFPTDRDVVYVALSECGYNRHGVLGEYKLRITPNRVARIGLRAAQKKVLGFRRYVRRYERQLTRTVNAGVRALLQSDKALGVRA